MKNKEELGLSYNIVLETINTITDEVIDRREVHNLITTAGKVEVAKLLNGVDTTYFRAIAIGEGAVAANIANTALGSEVARAAATLSYVATAKAKFVNTFTFTSGESYAITEVGVLNNATSGGDLLNRAVFAAINVDVTTSLAVTITMTIA